MYKDQIDITLANEDLTTFDTSLTAIETATEQILMSLPPEEIKRLAKIGFKTETFAYKALEIGKLNPGLLPRDLDLTKIERDVLAREQLAIRFVRVKQLYDKMHATMLLLGTDFYQGALAIYRALKANGRDAGLTTLLAELGVAFERPSQKKKPQPTPPDTGTQA